MSYEVMQEDIDMLRQATHEYLVKIELCNEEFKVLDSLEGICTSGSLTVSSEQAQRRTYRCDIVVKDSTFNIGIDKKIWINKRIRVYYGVKSIRTKNVSWYRIGTFAYVSVSAKTSQTEKTLSISLADMMAMYDGTLNGQIGGYGSANSDDSHLAQGLKIPAGEDIRSSVIALLKDARITRYNVEDIGKEIPYDQEFNTGVTYYEALKQICELYDSWEFFFDEDGVFIWRKIPNCYDDPIEIENDIMQAIVIDETYNADFSGIYNVTEVWGKVLELGDNDRYSESCTYNAETNTYSVEFDEYEAWGGEHGINNLTLMAMKIPAANEAEPRFSVNSFSSIPILDGDGTPLKKNALTKDTLYVFRFRKSTNASAEEFFNLYFLGQYQCYGKYIEESISCPFSVTNLGYEILQSIEQNTLSDDAACYNQAEYLNYTTTAMQDTITLTTMVIPWLDVNTKIQYRSLYNGDTKDPETWIAKNLNWNVGDGTMSLTLYKFSEDFSFVYNRRHGG